MRRPYPYPVWTPRSFTDASVRWLVDEPTALRTVVQLGGVGSPEHFAFQKRRTVERTVTFPSFTLRERDLWYVYCLMHHRRPVEEHQTWRELVRASVARQEMRVEVKAMAQTIAESFIEQGIERGIHQGKRELLLHQMQSKFGKVPEALRDWLIRTDDPSELERFSELVLHAESIDNLRAFAAKPRLARARRSPSR